jgi:hypothetical protein
MKNFFKLYISSDIFRVMKSMRTFYDARKKSAKYKILVGKPEGRKKNTSESYVDRRIIIKRIQGAVKNIIRVSAFQEGVYTCAVNHETGSSNGQTGGIWGY